MKYVIDASAAVEFLLKTAAGDAIAALVWNSDLFAPEMLDVEVLSVLRREVIRKVLPLRRAEEALADLLSWDVVRISHRTLAPHAWRYRNNVSTYDAMYVAAAKLEQVPVLTVDGPLSRAPGLDVVVQNIRVPVQ